MRLNIWLICCFLLTISCKRNPVRLQRIEGKQIPVNSKIAIDSSISAFVTPYKEKLNNKMGEVLAYAPLEYYIEEDKAESNIGNFMADLCYKWGNAIFHKKTDKNIDFVLLNSGGVRSGIPKGNVTIRSAYELMPFENSMVVVELTYENIQNLLTYLANAGKPHPVSKQLRISIEDNSIKSALLNGKKFIKDNTYFVLTSDYLQHGGDNMNFFKDPVSLENLDYKIRTAIIEELKEIDTISANKDGRVSRK